MEKSAVISLYQRSIEKNNLFYDPFVGDGDSSAYREVCQTQVYGPTKLINKEEDICHVIKRMGTQLRSIVRDYKGMYNSFLYQNDVSRFNLEVGGSVFHPLFLQVLNCQMAKSSMERDD